MAARFKIKPGCFNIQQLNKWFNVIKERKMTDEAERWSGGCRRIKKETVLLANLTEVGCMQEVVNRGWR